MRPPAFLSWPPALALGLLACAEAPPTDPALAWHTCNADLDCVSAAVVASVEQSPATATALVQQAPSSEARWLLVSRAVQAHPEHSHHLCGALANADLKQRCEKDTARPHLHAKPPEQRTQPGQRTAPGPHTSTLVIRPTAPSRYAHQGARTPTCAAGQTPIACAKTEAEALATRGDAREAAATCLSIADARWRGECALQAAEAVTRNLSPFRFDEAVELCLMAEEWVGRCVDKVHQHTAKLAPPASSGAEGWAPVMQAWHGMSMGWASQDKDLRIVVEDAYWSTVTAHAYRRVDRPTGDPLDHLPAAAHPHIRAAAAHAMLRSPPASPLSLEAQITALQGVLAARATESAATARTDPHTAARADHWAVDGPGDGELPATRYLGISRRVLAPTLEADLTICILEAAARQGGAWRGLLDTATGSTDRLVSATARRLVHDLERAAPRRQAPRKR